LEAFLAGGSNAVSGSGANNAAGMVNPSIFLQPTQTQEFSSQLQAMDIFDAPAFPLPSEAYPPLPEFNPDPDFEDILNMDMMFAQPAPQLEVEGEGEGEGERQGEREQEQGEGVGGEEEVLTVHQDQDQDQDHKHELVDDWLDRLFDTSTPTPTPAPACVYPDDV
jgi:hypothetical protein